MGITKIESRYENAKQVMRQRIIAEMENANYFLRQGNFEEQSRGCDIVSMLCSLYVKMFSESVMYEKGISIEEKAIQNRRRLECYKFVSFMRDEQHKERYLIT